MQSKLATLLGVVAVSKLVHGETADTHPIENVIKLLEKLSAQATEEGKSEALLFDKFMHWCSGSVKTLDSAIASGKGTIDTLTDQIAGQEKHIAQLDGEIKKLGEQLDEMGKASEAAKEQRTKGRELYETTKSDLADTIQAVKDAITALQDSGQTFLSLRLAKPKLKRALALVETKGITEDQRSALAFLMDKPQQLAEGDRDAHVKKYSFKSGNVIELLKELQRKFEDDLLAATKEETNAANADALETQARDAASEAASTAKTEKETIREDTRGKKNENSDALSAAEKTLADDSDTLSDTHNSCDTKTREWNERSKVRSNEIAAMGKAVEILSKSTGVRTEQPENPVPPPPPAAAAAEPPAFLQITDPKQTALNLLRSKASTLHSRTLEKMAQQLAAHMGDPFKDVNNMIEKMIFHLQAEQTDEDNHKAWCDQEKSKTRKSKSNKEEKITELTTKIDSATADVALLTKEISQDIEMIKKIDAFVAESKEIRETGKTENAAAIKDAQTAQNSLANAIAVLKDFYKSSGEIEKKAWEFVQVRGVELPENPATWDSSYTGVMDPTKPQEGIIAVLERTSADFAMMEADTKAAEAKDQKEFDDSMSASDIDRAKRTKNVEMKEHEKKRLLDKTDSMKKTLKHVSTELEAVNQYFEDLKPACMDGDSSYADRKAARDKEIDALRSAEQILAKAFEEEPSKTKTDLIAVHRH